MVYPGVKQRGGASYPGGKTAERVPRWGGLAALGRQEAGGQALVLVKVNRLIPESAGAGGWCSGGAGQMRRRTRGGRINRKGRGGRFPGVVAEVLSRGCFF